MFKNRALQVKMVNSTTTDNVDNTPTTSPMEYMQFARTYTKELVIGAAVVVGSYVVLDTLRQIAVNNTNPNH